MCHSVIEKRQRLTTQLFLGNYSYLCKTYDTQEKLDALINSWIADTAMLTDGEFQIGLDWCKLHESYKPSLALFVRKAKGLIDPDMAYELAINEQYDHPAIYYACKDIRGWGKLNENNRRESFIAAYKEKCQKIVEGAKFNTLQYDIFVQENYVNQFEGINHPRSGEEDYYDLYYGKSMADDGLINTINSADNQSISNPKGKILLVEDELTAQQITKYFLTELGYSVYLAVDICSAMKFYEKVDMIFLDIGLPKIDGFEFCKRVRKGDINKDVPIIGITALNIDLAAKAKAAGITEMHKKPVLYDKLEEITNQYLNSEVV